MPVLIKCPFCGNSSIEYGLALCRECHAEIGYDENRYATPELAEIEDNLDRLREQFEKLMVDYDARPLWLPSGGIKKKCYAAAELIALEEGRKEAVLGEYMASRERTSEVSFTRNDKTMIIDVWLPADPS